MKATMVLKPFGDYFLLDRFATGGMGEIYRGFAIDHSEIKKLIVIKKLKPNGHKRPDLNVDLFFRSEIKLTAQMLHPNIVKVLDVGSYGKDIFLTQEYVFGKNLKQLIAQFRKKGKTLPLYFSLYITEQIANGLAFAHGFTDGTDNKCLGIVHCDLSPDNILIGYNGHIKITDFGIANFKGQDRNRLTKKIIGKSSYMAPEQITRSELDARTDVFALGLILWELLCGRKLFRSWGHQTQSEVLKSVLNSKGSIPAPSTINESVPPQLDRLVMKALAFSPADRFQNISEMQVDLVKLLYRLKKDFSPFDFISFINNIFRTEKENDEIQMLSLIDTAKDMHIGVKHLSIEQVENVETTNGTEEIKAGDKAPLFEGMTYNGNLLSLKDFSGKKIWLAIYRYATCPLCNLHLSQVAKYQRRLIEENIQFIAVFESFPHEFRKKNQSSTPRLIDRVDFPLIADPHKNIYRSYKLKTSLIKTLHPKALIDLVKAHRAGFKQGKIQGDVGTIPAHFLINENGIVEKAHYCSNIVDHISWSCIEEFAGTSILDH